MEKVYSIGELARELGVTGPAVRAWLNNGIIEQPQLEGGGAQLFTEEQVDRIKKTITERRKIRVPRNPTKSQR